MTRDFDGYRTTYAAVVQSSVDFSGLPHAFFTAAKADVLGTVLTARRGAPFAPTALDVGCGVGTLHPYLRPLVGRLSAADVSSACVEEARRRNPWVEYEVSRGTRLPYDDRTFDLVLTVCVLHHVPPADRLAFAGELRRVARPGGLVCVIEHNPFNPLTRLAVMRCAFDRDAVLLRAGRTERLLRAAGLRALETRFFLLLPTKRGPAPWLEHRLRRVPLGAQYLTCGEA